MYDENTREEQLVTSNRVWEIYQIDEIKGNICF